MFHGSRLRLHPTFFHRLNLEVSGWKRDDTEVFSQPRPNPGDTPSNADAQTTTSSAGPSTNRRATRRNSSFHDYHSPLFSSTLQITVRLILLNPLRKEEKKKTKQKKESSRRAPERLFISFTVSPSASVSSLALIPPCVPLVMRQSCGSL